MENIQFSRAAYRLIERAVEALERIGRELDRYNDWHERTAEEGTDGSSPHES